MGPDRAQIELTLMGGFALHIDGRQVDMPMSGQRVTAFLALHGRPVSRGAVAGAVWFDKTEERAGANLRTVLWRLQESGLSIVKPMAAGMLRLADDVRADYRELLDWAQRLSRGRPRLEDLELDLAQSHWELLPEWYDEWVIMERERARQSWLHGLENLAMELLRVRRFSEGIEAALLAVAADPLRESARRAVMVVHLAEGNYSEAVKEYASYRALLWRDLGVEPSPQLGQLLDCRAPVGPPEPRALLETGAGLR